MIAWGLSYPLKYMYQSETVILSWRALVQRLKMVEGTLRVKNQENLVPDKYSIFYKSVLGNPGVTHSIPTAFMNAMGTEWFMPRLPMLHVWSYGKLSF